MDEMKNLFDDHRSKSTIDRLYKKIDELLQVDFSEFGDLSDTFKAALEEEIKQLFRQAIAEVCGISVEDVTDEYIRIAQTTLPIAGMTEDGSLWDGHRHLTDEELIERLKPLIERKQDIGNKIGVIKTRPTGGMTEDGIIWDGEEVYIDENEKPILIDEEIDVEEKPILIDEEKYINEVQSVNDIISALFDKYYKMEDLELSEEDMKKYYVELVEEAKKFIAEVLNIDESFIVDSELDMFFRGQMIEEKVDDKLMMKMIPFKEEDLKYVFNSSIEKSKKSVLNDMFQSPGETSNDIIYDEGYTK